MFKALYNLNDRKKNNLLVNTIKSGLSDLKNTIKEMSKNEIKIEKPYDIVDVVEEILEFNEQKKPRRTRLKICNTNQMLSRLPISLAQLKAGNNSEKLNRFVFAISNRKTKTSELLLINILELRSFS